MNCKFCGEQMSERGTFCPVCGRDNAPEAMAAETILNPVEAVQVVPPEVEIAENAQQTQEFLEPQAKKAKRTAAIIGCVAVLAVLAIALIWWIGGNNFQLGGDPTLSTAPTNPAPTGTVPPAGNPDDVTCKGSYLVSDEVSVQSADVVVATLGDAELTNSQLQIFYQMEVLNFIQSYSYYLPYLGLDYTQPLDQQPCAMKEGYTWHQYFLECALLTWQQGQVLTQEAEKNQFQMDEETRTYLDGLEANMQETATKGGFDTVDELMQTQLGANTSLEGWREYLEVSMYSYQYYAKLCQDIETPSDEALATYFQENKEVLESQGIKQDGSYVVDVRHILIKVDGGVENQDGSITFPDAAVAAEAKSKAEQILAQWLENPTEENFGILAKEHTADGNGEVGGLYEDVTQGRMVKTFNDWCFDASRAYGDYGIVETRFGYHIMFFAGRGEEIWLTNTRQAYLSQQQVKLLEGLMEQYEIDIHFGKIVLANVDLV